MPEAPAWFCTGRFIFLLREYETQPGMDVPRTARHEPKRLSSDDPVTLRPALFVPVKRRSLTAAPHPPPPCFCYEYQNKGVRSIDLVMNIKTKDLARVKRSRWKPFVLMLFMRSSDGDTFLNSAGWKFQNLEGQKRGSSKSAVQGSASSGS